MITTLNNLLSRCLLLAPLLFATACTNNASQQQAAHGKYKMYSDDPAVNRFIAFEDNYIQVNKDNSIVYNSTINNKPKFNFKGTYTYDHSSNTLTIKWSEGNLPDKIKIEKNGNDDFIRIGETSYKKEKPN